MSTIILQRILFYIAFLAGQGLFLLKRADSAIRNPTTTILRRRDFLYHNWVTILVRAAIELVAVFYPWQHFSTSQILAFFGWSAWAGLTAGFSSVATAFVLGFAADSILDWISISQKTPEFLRNWIRENVPQIPTIKNGEKQ